jgi:2,5-diamino-6-(ribosylamino)-4(3H)-pyrimidinone 5'-phosphate reductase
MAKTRPHVICHMVPSVDGRIVTTRWNMARAVSAEYERTAETLKGDAWMIGRISMEPYAGKARVPKRAPSSPIPRNDVFARRDAPGFAIALDPSGKLAWTSASIDEEHVVTVLTEEVSDAYLAFLREKGVSYVFGGKKTIDLERVLVKLRKELGIKRLLLEGGGGINGSFLAAGLVDELSVLVAPIADGSVGTPSLFDVKGRSKPQALRLTSMEKRKGGVVWLRYAVVR